MHAASIIIATLFISQIPFYMKLINQARLYTKTCVWLDTYYSTSIDILSFCIFLEL